MWSEVGKKGADVAIGAVVDAAKDGGVKGMGALGTIYSLASAINDAGGAMGLAKQNRDWRAELDALELCAENPTNPVSRSDPNYSRVTVDKIRAARKELSEVNSVRFLNQMAEKTADFNVVTTIMSVGLKQGFAWSEQTLENYSENTIMREARVAVVACSAGDSKGNLHFKEESTAGTGRHLQRTVETVVANVTWKWMAPVGGAEFGGCCVYRSGGTFEARVVRQAGKCTATGIAQGSLEGTGDLVVFSSPALIKEKGYGYDARLLSHPTTMTFTSSCGPGYTTEYSLANLIKLRGYVGAGGNIEGKRSEPSPLGGRVTSWSFAVPPAK